MQPVTLTAGPLSLRFEPDSGMIRQIAVHGDQAVNAVYAAIRDADWGTVAPELGDLKIDQRADEFTITFTARCHRPSIAFDWHGRIEGTRDGVVTYTFDGEAKSTFASNRIGFCVLHPLDCAGEPCVIEHVNGSEESTRFPDAISPHQPFFDVRTIRHTTPTGHKVDVRMEGETFETEDQRNWTDASFKTYCTPLSRPFPVERHVGECARQAVTITATPGATASRVTRTATSDVVDCAVIQDDSSPLPALGLEATPGHAHTEHEIARLAEVQPAHVRVEARLAQHDWQIASAHGLHLAKALNSSVELAVFCEKDASGLDALKDWLKREQPSLARVLVLSSTEKATPDNLLVTARQKLADVLGNALLFGGTDAFFAELNRHRPSPAAVDGMTYSINPQVHAFDDLSLAETLEAQGHTVRSAAAIAGGKPIAVSPVTLRMRWNPNATGPQPEPDPGALPPIADPRQLTAFGAAWTLGSIKHLAEAGAGSITFYRSVGYDGLMEHASGSPLPDLWPSRAGQLYPLAKLLAAVNKRQGATVVRSTTSRPLDVVSLALQAGNDHPLFLANLTDVAQQVAVGEQAIQLAPHEWKIVTW